jgi:hypothetical protein
LDAKLGGWIGSGSAERALVSAREPSSGFLRRGAAAAACVGFASFGAEAVVGVAVTLSVWLSVSLRTISATGA